MEQLSVAVMVSDPAINARIVRALSHVPGQLSVQALESPARDGRFLDREALRTNPDVVFLEMAAAGERALDVIRMAKARPSPPAIITIHASADTEALLAAFRAGADDCLYLPLEDGGVRQVFERLLARRERQRPQRPPAKTVGFLSVTGGCGGTMLACHFGHELWQASSQSTLLADFDLLGGMVGFWMRAAGDYSIWDVVRGWQRLDLSMWRGLVANCQPQLDVLSAPSEVVTDEICDPEQLFNVLQFARANYEWVVADLGAGMTTAALRMLGQLNALFVVSTAELPVLYQCKRILRKLVALGYPRRRVRLVLNCVRRRQLQADEVASALGWEVAADLPQSFADLEEAQADGKLLPRRSELGKRIVQLATKFMGERLEEADGFQVPLRGVPEPVTALTRVWQQSYR